MLANSTSIVMLSYADNIGFLMDYSRRLFSKRLRSLTFLPLFLLSIHASATALFTKIMCGEFMILPAMEWKLNFI